jgi:hypothetical protein
MSTKTRFFTVWLLTLSLMGAVALTAFLSLPAKAQSRGAGPPIRLVRTTFDPLVESPALPHDLVLRAYPEGFGLYLLQFDGPIQASWKDDARRLGVQLFDYVPDYAFLAWMNEASVARAAAQPRRSRARSAWGCPIWATRSFCPSCSANKPQIPQIPRIFQSVESVVQILI